MIPLRTPLAKTVLATFFAFCAVVCVGGIVKVDVRGIVAFPLFILLACGFYRSAYLQCREDETLKRGLLPSRNLGEQTRPTILTTETPEGSTWETNHQDHNVAVHQQPKEESQTTAVVPQDYSRALSSDWDPSLGDSIRIVIVTAGLLVFFLVVVIVVGNSKTDNNSQGENPIDVALKRTHAPDVSDLAGKQVVEAPPPVPVCPSGIPANAKVDSVEVRGINASDGKAWYDATDHFIEYRLDQLAAHGFTDDGYYVGQWYFSFNVTNDTAASQTDQPTGYCLTGLQYQVDLQSDDGKHWQGSGKYDLDHPLTPGWRQEIPRQKITVKGRPKDARLVKWQITRAWGFPLILAVIR